MRGARIVGREGRQGPEVGIGVDGDDPEVERRGQQVAIRKLVVVFPTPPFGDMTAMVLARLTPTRRRRRVSCSSSRRSRADATRRRSEEISLCGDVSETGRPATIGRL
jgi:hypothetical protein